MVFQDITRPLAVTCCPPTVLDCVIISSVENVPVKVGEKITARVADNVIADVSSVVPYWFGFITRPIRR